MTVSGQSVKFKMWLDGLGIKEGTGETTWVRLKMESGQNGFKIENQA